MRKITFRILSLLCVVMISISFSYAQSAYIPLLKQNNQWNILRSHLNPGNLYTEIYRVDIDTIINGNHCEKIVTSNDSALNAAYNFAYYMYEDTSLKKIFTLDDNFNLKLYFDFNVKVGDTLSLYCPYSHLNQSDTFYVAQIDSVNLDGIYRKRVSINFKINGILVPADDWIEGFGTFKGLHYGGYPGIGPYINLLCFSSNNQIIYQNTGYSNCYYTNVGIKEFENQLISIYPNPVTDHLFIKTAQTNEYFLQIFDIYGRLVFEQELNKRESMVPISNLKKGIYHVVIYNNDNNKVLSDKIIKL